MPKWQFYTKRDRIIDPITASGAHPTDALSKVAVLFLHHRAYDVTRYPLVTGTCKASKKLWIQYHGRDNSVHRAYVNYREIAND